MSSCMNDRLSDKQNASPYIDESPSKLDEDKNEGEDEDEEQDVDFNPFLKGTPSPEASSSLSSEIEGLDGNSSKPMDEAQNYSVGESEHGEVVVMQTSVSPESEKELQKPVHKKSKRRKSDSSYQLENDNFQEKENGSGKPTINTDDDDAICKRTRARYSLASFTLDELETFLQETDDEDDLQNVDEEEEYRKFLAAVLQGGDSDVQPALENENIYDDDEDNDADFEIELEEFLESDVDDNTRDKDHVDYEKAGRRPETRQNRRQKASAQYKKKLLEQGKRPLRPLLPIFPNGVIASFPIVDGKALKPQTVPSCPSTAEDGLVNGFTSQQIAQLHCLIHEHLQLLIQVFSLCILDSSRQHIASQVQGLIFEMLQKRDEVVACRSVPYPDICFHTAYLCPSVSDDLPNYFTSAKCTSPTLNMQMRDSHNISSSKDRHENLVTRQMGSPLTAGSFWVPFISGPIVSILDVSPLTLVRKYMEDVYNAVREYRQRQVDSSCDTRYEKEPLFHLPHFPSLAEANGEVLRGNIPLAADTVPSAPGQQPVKKTLAASIVERAKKQSIASVPKDISKLMQRFFPLFNPALFPHKPPPAAVANRVLFTDAEDELLALGMMEYNTDWEAIQQRFLPCKSKHQIFVRQKNRCSSKAPENPIKVVRRMKTSPLTAEEIERIQEGLRVFKLDWMSVWRFVAPYRDPSLLPRQWRIALGTQRSYKLDAAKKEKRRIYESNRRRCKTVALADWKMNNRADGISGENNSADDCVDNVNEAYVHQAFLADWRPGAPTLISSELPCSNTKEKDLASNTLSGEGACIRKQPNDYGPEEAQCRTDNMHGYPHMSSYYQYPHTTSHFTDVRNYDTIQPNHPVSNVTLNSSKSQIYLWPYRTHGTDGAHLVKLAPELPPVNLPPSVRVISQSAFKSNQCVGSVKLSATGGGSGDAGKENMVTQPPLIANFRAPNLVKTRRANSIQVTGNYRNPCAEGFRDSCQEESAVAHDSCTHEERGSDTDLQMHPLLFQAPEDGRLPYYQLSCSNGIPSSFSFFSGNQPQLNLSLFHNSHQANHAIDSFNKSSKTKENTAASCGIDFHPLLQRMDEENNDVVTACSNVHQLVCLGGNSSQFQIPFDPVQKKSPVNGGSFTTGPKASALTEKVNGLDLEIHLSSTSTKEKTSKDVDLDYQPRSTINAPDSGNTVETHKTNSPCHDHSENCATLHSNPISDVEASAVRSNNFSGCNMDDIGDQSHMEIVMEQEELSDSDEEIEEHVEFECEEMADSDGEEGSDCEPNTEDVPSFATEKASTDADYDDQQCESSSLVHPEGNASIHNKGSPFLKLSLMNLGSEDNTNSSWLSLDSCAPVGPPMVKAKHGDCAFSEGSAAKYLASCRPNRSSKKTTPTAKRVPMQKDGRDVAKQLCLGPLAVPTLRKPRKRTCRTNPSSSMEMTTENSTSNQVKFR